MPELLPKGHSAQLRLTASLLAGALSLCAVPTPSLAQPPPADLRACAAESDPGRRLACYDKEMGRSSPSAPRQPAAPAAAQASNPPPAQAPHAAHPAPANPAPPSREPPAPRRTSPWKVLSGGDSEMTARVTHLDRWPGAMVLHLDNGQVWRQVGRASGDLSLQTGDSVKIEKHLGSYWLSSRYVSNMKVRQQPR